MSQSRRVHTVLPDELAAAADAVLRLFGIDVVAHGEGDPMAAAEEAAADAAAVALLGPFQSSTVAEVVEATAPAGLALLAPVATWAGVTRDDEPGSDGEDEDPADHRGTVFRLVARDTVVAARVAAHLREMRQRAYVVTGHHPYAAQLDGQLRLGRLDRSGEVDTADVIVVCGLAGEAEVARVATLPPLPVIAFDGVQGEDFGAEREVHVALPYAPIGEADAFDQTAYGSERASYAAELVVSAVQDGSGDRAGVLSALRASGLFDDHGDPVEPAVWLWSADESWVLRPDRAL